MGEVRSVPDAICLDARRCVIAESEADARGGCRRPQICFPSNEGGFLMSDVRTVPNWRWIRHRIMSAFQCRHQWMAGAKVSGEQACRKCGVWRWFPMTEVIRRAR